MGAIEFVMIRTLEEHDLLIAETKQKMDIAKENGYYRAWKDLKKYYDKLIQQRRVFKEVMKL